MIKNYVFEKVNTVRSSLKLITVELSLIFVEIYLDIMSRCKLT